MKQRTYCLCGWLTHHRKMSNIDSLPTYFEGQLPLSKHIGLNGRWTGQCQRTDQAHFSRAFPNGGTGKNRFALFCHRFFSFDWLSFRSLPSMCLFLMRRGIDTLWPCNYSFADAATDAWSHSDDVVPKEADCFNLNRGWYVYDWRCLVLSTPMCSAVE